MPSDPVSATDEPSSGRLVGYRFALLAVALLIYVGVPAYRVESRRMPSRMEPLAQAFAQGRLSVEVAPAASGRSRNLNELIPAPNDRFYVAYPPLPAILLVPFVWAGIPLSAALLCRLVSAAIVLLFDLCLGRMFGVLGRRSPPLATRIALDLLFAFGTVVWHNADMAGDWHLAHAVAMAGMLAAMYEYAGRNRPLVVGLCVAIVMGARPTAALTCLFFAIPLVLAARPGRRLALVKMAVAPAAAIFCLALYNHARFGSPTDFGYERMLLIGEGARNLATYGQFHPHFIAANAYWFFAAPPVPLPSGQAPYLGYDPRGMSLFIATPALLYAVLGAVRHWRLPPVRHAVIAISICLVPLLLYFNTGFWQFGHRFSLDYLPVLFVLVIAGVGRRVGRVGLGLIALSILIHAVGILVNPAVAGG